MASQRIILAITFLRPLRALSETGRYELGLRPHCRHNGAVTCRVQTSKSNVETNKYRQLSEGLRIFTEMANNSEQLQSGYDGTITVDWHGDIAVITADCGENRMNTSYFEKFNKALDQVLQNPQVKALVTTGKGKFYSNGLDLNWLGQLDQKSLDRYFIEIRNFWERIFTFPLPTAAAINGHAFAGGAVTSLSHDFRVMNSERGWWCLNEVHIGLRFSSFSLGLVKEKLSKPTFHEALVMGKRFTAAEAKRSGIIQDSSPPDEIITSAIKLLKEVIPAKGYNRNFLKAGKGDAYRRLLEAEDVPAGGIKSNM